MHKLKELASLGEVPFELLIMKFFHGTSRAANETFKIKLVQ